METVIIIPARYESSRFPGKPLALIHGCPMIGQVILRAKQVAGVDQVCVATDDERIRECARPFQVPVLRTQPSHRSGTDRLAEAAAQLDLAPDTLVVNVQGDQPFFPVEAVSDLITRHGANPHWPMSTLIYRITDPAEIPDPKHVKTVFDSTGRALYFSRSPIPFYRDGDPDQTYYKHLGIYAFRRDFLDIFFFPAHRPPGGRREARTAPGPRARLPGPGDHHPPRFLRGGFPGGPASVAGR